MPEKNAKSTGVVQEKKVESGGDIGQELQGRLLHIRYVDIEQVVKWDRNPKLHDIGGMVESIKRHGFRDAPIYDGVLGAIVAGNGRAEALLWMRGNGDDPPVGVGVDEDGRWYIPLQFGVDAKSRFAAEAFGLDHNNLTMMGGDFGLGEMVRLWSEKEYIELLKELEGMGEFPISLDLDDLDALLAVYQGQGFGNPDGPKKMETEGRSVDIIRVRVYQFDQLERLVVLIRELIMDEGLNAEVEVQ